MSTRTRGRNKSFLVILLLLIVSLVGGLPASDATNYFQWLFVSLSLVVGLSWLCTHLAQSPVVTFKSEQLTKTTLCHIQTDCSNLRFGGLSPNFSPV